MKQLLMIFLVLVLGFPLFKNSISYCYAADRPDREVRIVREYIDRSIRPTPSPLPSTAPISSPSPLPTTPPFPTTSPRPSLTPTPTPDVNIVKDFIMSAINHYRRQKGLPSVQTDPYTCAFAKIRSQEIATNFSHDGFGQRGEAGTFPYPSYQFVTENLAYTSDYRRVVYLWINSSSHAANLDADTPFVCVEQTGNYYAYEGWRP